MVCACMHAKHACHQPPPGVSAGILSTTEPVHTPIKCVEPCVGQPAPGRGCGVPLAALTHSAPEVSSSAKAKDGHGPRPEISCPSRHMLPTPCAAYPCQKPPAKWPPRCSGSPLHEGRWRGHCHTLAPLTSANSTPHHHHHPSSPLHVVKGAWLRLEVWELSGGCSVGP